MSEEFHLLTAREVCRVAAFSHATLYRLCDAGLFPKPIKIGRAAVRWRSDEVYAHIEQLSAARAV